MFRLLHFPKETEVVARTNRGQTSTTFPRPALIRGHLFFLLCSDARLTFDTEEKKRGK